MDANTNPIELCGTVAAVIYQNEENGYTVLKLDVDDGSQTMVVGCIPYAVPGESMIVTGNWMTHPAHGQQFKAEFAERTMPETADAIYAYLAGRAVRGIGPATASLLVSRFGADTLNVLEYEPEKLTAIKGISLSKAKAMSANFRRQAGMRRLIEFLASANIRPVIALRMYQYYGDEYNTYRLPYNSVIINFFGSSVRQFLNCIFYPCKIRRNTKPEITSYLSVISQIYFNSFVRNSSNIRLSDFTSHNTRHLNWC